MLCGDALNSAALVRKLRGEYTVCNPEEVGGLADLQGVIGIAPPIEAVVDDDYEQVNNYYNWFASFLGVNHIVLAEYGADDIRIFMEVFYAEGHQCNIAIFDKETISIIGKFNVALPISIYALKEDVITKWVEEIKTINRNSL